MFASVGELKAARHVTGLAKNINIDACQRGVCAFDLVYAALDVGNGVHLPQKRPAGHGLAIGTRQPRVVSLKANISPETSQQQEGDRDVVSPAKDDSEKLALSGPEYRILVPSTSPIETLENAFEHVVLS